MSLLYTTFSTRTETKWFNYEKQKNLVHFYHNFLACDMISNWFTFGLDCTRILILKIAVWASGVAQRAKLPPPSLLTRVWPQDSAVRNSPTSRLLAAVCMLLPSPKNEKNKEIFFKKLPFDSYFSHFVLLLCNSILSIADYKTKLLNQLWKQGRWPVSQKSKNSAKFSSLCKNKDIHFICVQTHFCLYSPVKLHVNQKCIKINSLVYYQCVSFTI